MINNEQQLSEKIVNEKMIRILQQTDYMTPQHMILIDTVLIMPDVTIEAECQRQIAVINAVIAFCNMKKSALLRFVLI